MKLKDILIYGSYLFVMVFSLIFIGFIVGNAYGASVIVSPKFTAYDSNGEPLSGGLLYTYSCGTTTDKATYTTYTGGTANANPVVLDTRGEGAVYASGCLKLVLKDSAETTIWTVDNIYSFDQTILQDADRNTLIQVEESADEDTIRFDIDGTQKMYIDSDGVHIGTTVTTEANGRVERAKFRWKDGDEIYIGAGAYHHSGTSEQFVYWNSELTFELEATGSNTLSDDYAADGWHYIYLDDSAIVTQASALLDKDCFLNETTAPTYSATKHGWYNGSDRCIFAVYETGGVALEFYPNMGGYSPWSSTTSHQIGAGDVDNTWEAKSLVVGMPGFATMADVAAVCRVKTADANVSFYIRPTGSTNTTIMTQLERIAVDQYITAGPLKVTTNASQSVDIQVSRDGDDTMGLFIHGWYFPHGM